MDDIKSKLVSYKLMPVWHRNDIPAGFQRQHNTKVGTWAQLTIFKGSIEFVTMEPDGTITGEFHFDKDNQPPLIHPQEWHMLVSATDDIECQMDFMCMPEDYFAKRHDIGRTHPDVVEAMEHVSGERALDIGCGNGRNTLYLAQRGFHVDAWDWAAERLDNLQRIADAEKLDDRIYISEVDLNLRRAGNFDGPYDFVLSTVVFMFLQPDAIPSLIESMKNETAPGGVNLIVSAMDSDDYPCRMPFPFRFQSGELKQYYADWEIIKYDENPGKLHKTDENGNRIEMRFATILARKPE
ncbi:MAG: SAM-dependent methyltransferase TehB [Lautropia sp.]|nr:SAM-dependent methyltransferase TehB [Lautropia sp.]